MKSVLFGTAALAAVFLTGCGTPIPPGAERGPHGTMAYEVLVETVPQGARLEVNGEDVGNAPVRLKIFGDPDGTFHDFGSYHYVVRALPVTSNQFVQTRFFQTGHMMTPEDRIPQKITLDMNQPPSPPLGAPAYGPPAYYGPPVYYYGPAPYYRPGVRVYIGPGYHHRW